MAVELGENNVWKRADGAENFLVFDSTENVVECGIGRGGWVSERWWRFQDA